MMSMTSTMRTTVPLILTLCSLVAGCAPPSSAPTAATPEPAAAPPPPAEPAVPAEPSADLVAKLAAADRVDGKEDHVVANCPGCGLAMPGSTDHAVQFGDYSLHFCSDQCRNAFTGDLTASLSTLEVPGTGGTPPPEAPAP